MQASAWRVFVLVLLRGLSMGPLSELRTCFEERKAVTRLAQYLSKEGFDFEHFQALLGLILDPC